MKFKIDSILCYSVASFLFGAVFFVYGFFPLSFSSDERAKLSDLPNFIYNVP